LLQWRRRQSPLSRNNRLREKQAADRIKKNNKRAANRIASAKRYPKLVRRGGGISVVAKVKD
jgi:hypothetical protein